MPRPQRTSALFRIDDDVEDVVPFEKIAHAPRAAMPVSVFRKATKTAHKTAASRRAGRKFSLTHGGLHRRRNKRGF